MEERLSPPNTFGAERKGAKVEAHQEGRLKEAFGPPVTERWQRTLNSLNQPDKIMTF